MLMDSFEVENFRSLKHLKLEKLARVNLLVGKNNSGKTSVLEAIYVLTRIEVADWFELLESMRGLEESDQDFRSLFYGFNVNNTIKVKSTYKGAKRDLGRFRFQLEPIPESITRRRRKGQKALIVSIWLGGEKQAHVLEMTRDTGEEAVYESISEGADDFIEDGLPEKLAERHESNFLSTTISLDALSEQLSDLTLNREAETLIDIMRQIDPRIVSMSLDSKGKIYFDLGKSFSMLSPINLMGEGVQRLLSIVTAIASTSGGIIIIDELDNGLHYSALRTLWKGILVAAREYDVQIIATTHSEEALRHLTWVLDDEKQSVYRDDIAAYSLIRADDDTVRSYRHDYGQLEYAIEHGIEVRN